MEQTDNWEKPQYTEFTDLDKRINRNLLTVDVIIPVYKPDNKFNLLIERLVKQSIKPMHIILLHTIENEPKEEEALKDALNFTTASCPILCIDILKSDFDHGGTRNYGASLSQADVVMFMTQDAVPVDRYLIEHLIEPFQNPQVAAAYGRQLPNQKSGFIEQYTRTFNYPDKDQMKSLEDLPELGIKTYFCSNVCAAYRKTIYTELGGFVTKTIFNEDMIMAAGIINAGYSIMYAAKAKVLHSHVYTYRQQFSRNFDLAVSQQQYKHIFGSVKSETEGKRLVFDTLQYLAEKKQYLLIPDLILQSGFKYLGFLAGKHYEVLPKEIVKKLSMNPSYWK